MTVSGEVANAAQVDEFDDPDEGELERRTAVGAFEFAKSRYVRSLTAETEAKFLAVYTKQRAALAEEIGNLRLLARSRHEGAWAAAQRYAQKLPHRVGKNGFTAPSGLDRSTQSGVDKLYREAKRYATELEEVNELLRKRLISLGDLDRDIRNSIAKREVAARKMLDTADGLSMAIRRDPLFERAYERVKALPPFVVPPAATEANALADVVSERVAQAEAPPSFVTTSRLEPAP